MNLVDPSRYAIPRGFIELRHALAETVRLQFGEFWSREMTLSEIETEVRKPRFDKTKRERRWTVARLRLVRAFRDGTLQTFVLDTGIPKPLDPSLWREWTQSWRPFFIDSLKSSDAPIYLLKRDQLLKWAARRDSARPQNVSQANLEVYVTGYIRTCRAAGKTPSQLGLENQATAQPFPAKRKQLRDEYTRQIVGNGKLRLGRPRKNSPA